MEAEAEEEGTPVREDHDMVNLTHRSGCDFAHWDCCQTLWKIPPAGPYSTLLSSTQGVTVTATSTFIRIYDSGAFFLFGSSD